MQKPSRASFASAIDETSFKRGGADVTIDGKILKTLKEEDIMFRRSLVKSTAAQAIKEGKRKGTLMHNLRKKSIKKTKKKKT